MKKISFVVGRDYLNNKIFDLSNSVLNRDDCLKAFFLLKNEFEKHGYEMATQDLISPDKADFVIFNEMPKSSLSNINPSKSSLIIFETELIRPDNWNLNHHKRFNKIFTWHDPIVDNKKYFKFNFPNTFKMFEVNSIKRPKLLTLISGNKKSTHSLELYSKRFEAIKWFELSHPNEFDYYGVGWDYKFDIWWQKVFRKLNVLSFMPKNKSFCYKGKVKDKYSTLLNYQFAICYENGRDIEGYVTEKIFDCFFAGCIPIYWGASNILNFVPEKAFIDRNKFETYEDLYKYLKLMTLEEIQERQRVILDFLNSEQAFSFSNEGFVKNIVEGILNE